MRRYIDKLISKGENQNLDFKFEISDSRKIARTLVAFSNTDGGKLLIGVKDNGNISGIHSDEEIHMLEGAAKLYCRPEIIIKVQLWTIDGKNIIEADIPEGKTKPYYAKEPNGKWLAWFRQEDENHLASRVMLEVWKNQQRNRDISLKFTKTEAFLLSYLNECKNITIEELCKIANINQKKATAILSKLISFDILSYEYRDGNFYYFATEK